MGGLAGPLQKSKPLRRTRKTRLKTRLDFCAQKSRLPARAFEATKSATLKPSGQNLEQAEEFVLDVYYKFKTQPKKKKELMGDARFAAPTVLDGRH